jgi:hypothetical protein
MTDTSNKRKFDEMDIIPSNNIMMPKLFNPFIDNYIEKSDDSDSDETYSEKTTPIKPIKDNIYSKFFSKRSGNKSKLHRLLECIYDYIDNTERCQSIIRLYTLLDLNKIIIELKNEIKTFTIESQFEKPTINFDDYANVSLTSSVNITRLKNSLLDGVKFLDNLEKLRHSNTHLNNLKKLYQIIKIERNNKEDDV